MLQCEVFFHEKPDVSSGDKQDGAQSDSTTDGALQASFLTTTNYQLSFFHEKTNDQPFYETNIGELSSQRNTNSKSLTLSQKRAHHPLITIYASTPVLEKVETMFKEYSNEKIAWNLLMDTPYQRPKDSYLSNINENSSFKGIVTLLAIMCFFAKARDVINNHFTYGLLPMEDLGSNKFLLLVYALSTIVFTSLTMLAIEKLALKGFIPQRIAAFLETINIFIAYGLKVYFCNTYKPHVTVAIIYVMTALIVILKQISYMHFMYELRDSLPKILDSQQSKNPIRMEASQENLNIIQKHAEDPSELVTVKDILYFYFAPVLVYQLWYPRTEEINKRRAVRLGAELIFFITFQLYWTNQFLIPMVKSSTEVFQCGTALQIMDKFFEASNTYLPFIVINTYNFFHVLPNFLAEVLRFSNRDFYSDWWNNTSIRTFWNRWNLPVHKWCVRHIYNPLQQRGCSKTVSTCGVFLFSGLMHGYFFCVPVRLIEFKAILGLFLQAPMMIVEAKYSRIFKKYYIGNIFMWVGFWCVTITVGVVTYRAKYLEVNADE